MLKIKTILLKIFVLCFGLVLALLFLESIVRVFGLAQQTANIYQSDPVLGYKHVPNSHGWWRAKEFKTKLQFNREGFRDVDHAVDKPLGVHRIVVLGDSYVEAAQVPLERAFHRILETKLNEKITSGKYEVINFGVAGFGISQDYLALQKYGYKYKPDMIILTVTTGNDIRNAHPALERDDSKPYYLLDEKRNLYLRPFTMEKESIGRFFSDHIMFPHSYIYLMQTIRPLWLNYRANKIMSKEALTIPLDKYVYAEPYPKVWQDAWQATLALILQMKKDTQERNIELLVVALTDGDGQIDGSLQLDLDKKTEGRSVKLDSEKPLKILDGFCKDNKISFLPLLYEFRKDFSRTHEKYHYTRDGHWNKKGHELAAEVIYRKILADKMAE